MCENSPGDLSEFKFNMLKSLNYIFIYLYLVILKDVLNVNSEEVCSTDGCIKSAELLKSSMNLRVNPCNDFYEFACGGFISRNHLINVIGINSFSIIREITYEQVNEILSESISENEIKPFQIAKQFYKDCLDEETILIHGLRPIVDKIRDLGGWPIAESSWDDDKFSWIEAVQKSRQMGFSGTYILSFEIETNLLNSSSRAIYISPPDLGIPNNNLKRGVLDEKVKMYYKIMISLAMKLKVPVQTALLELASALQFEINLAQYFPTTSDKKQDIKKNFLSMSISQAQEKFPSIDWMKFIRSMLNPSDKLHESDIIVVAYPEFVSQLENLLKSTPKRTLANYFIWRLIYFSLNSYLIASGTPRWKNCAAITTDKMSVAVASMYVRRFFNDGSKERITEISENVKKKMHETLLEVDWIDQRTKKNALEKIKSITENVGYPEMLLNDKKLQEIYRDLKIKPGEYYESLLAIKRFNMNFTISTLKKPVIKSHWLAYENPLIVNAFYALPENSIKIPIALLQRNVFSKNRPNYLNYGSIGFIIGHELSHAFDDQGSSFDKDGNYKDWWPPETKKKYLDKVRCFVDQYSKYVIEGTGKHVNGYLTQGENIADTEGVREAYRAYEGWLRENNPEPKLPGLDFTPKQLFWISAANVWCSKYSKTYFDMIHGDDLHAPDKVRIIGAFSNQREFSKDFGCAVDSPMNPSKKCSLWK